jgi:hypothetical protein
MEFLHHAMDNSAFTNNTLVLHSNLEEYTQTLETSLREFNLSLTTKIGELRAEETFRSSISSHKVNFKIFNWELQTLLERWVEPYSVIWWRVFGGSYSGRYITRGFVGGCKSNII